MISGGVGGFLASILGLKATGMDLTGIPGTLLYLNNQFPLYILTNVAAMAVAFVLTYTIGYKEEPETVPASGIPVPRHLHPPHGPSFSAPPASFTHLFPAVDTASMNGDGSSAMVQERQQVKAGERLLTFDRAKIAAAEHSDVVVVLVTNSDDYQNLTIQSGECKVLDKVIEVK